MASHAGARPQLLSKTCNTEQAELLLDSYALELGAMTTQLILVDKVPPRTSACPSRAGNSTTSAARPLHGGSAYQWSCHRHLSLPP